LPFNTSLKQYFLKNLIDDLNPSSENSVLFFVGRPDAWDSSTPDYQDDKESFNDAYRRMIGAKKVTSADACLMIPKNRWSSGATFDMYTSDKDMSENTRFYTTNADDHVYKCLYNGATGSASVPSLYEPYGTSNTNIKLPDGYVWKFMYRVPESLERFVTALEIPVKNLSVEEEDPNRYSDDRSNQYSVQYNAVEGSLSFIELTSAGSSFPNAINQTPDTLLVDAYNDGLTGYATLNNASSSDNDTYNDYVLRIVSGTGVGQKRKIADYSGSSRIVTLEGAWSVIPDTTSRYQIIPEVAIYGDGVSADAIAVMNGKFIDSIDLLNNGSNYTYVSAEVTTPTVEAPVLDPHLAPSGGHGSNPELELVATKVQILTRIGYSDSFITGDNIDGSFPIVNDYRQYGLIRNPIFADGPFAGEVVGSRSSSSTRIYIDAATGSLFGPNDLAEGDFVVGENSKSCGQVSNFSRSTDPRTAIVTLTDANTSFLSKEKVVGLGTGAVWSSSGKLEGYYKYADETVPALESDTYRLSTRLIVGATGVDSSHIFDRTDLTLDFILGGASGSSGTVLETVPSGGNTCCVYLTSIFRDTDSGEFGFTTGEYLTNSSVITQILEVDPPAFEFGSGQIIYIENRGAITRNNEQEEEFKISFDI